MYKKINKWISSEIKTFIIWEILLRKSKQEATDWEKIYATQISGLKLVCKLYEEYLITRETTNFKKWVIYFNRNFTKEDIQIVNKHMKWC